MNRTSLQWVPNSLLWLHFLPLCWVWNCEPVGETPPAPDTTLEVSSSELTPAPPVLARLTRLQYTSAISDLFGPTIVVPAGLEPDLVQDGLLSIGATVSSLSPVGVEKNADIALKLADQIVLLDPIPTFFCPDSAHADCLETRIRNGGRLIWRRPLAEDEVSTLLKLGNAARAALPDDPLAGERYVLVALLSSPYFLYRVEFGEPDPAVPEHRRYTAMELASRLSFFLWSSVPDDLLLDAADSGELLTEQGLSKQIDRMLASPKIKRSVRNFFAEWLDLISLDELNKDPTLFPHFAADLGASAREETLRTVEHIIFEKDADIRELLTTETTFVDKRLAALYGLPATVLDGFGQVQLPDFGQRAGILGQVSFLAKQAHPVSSSATLRGLFIRERLLCQPLPTPPANLNTAIPEPGPGALTLRDRLVVHMEEPSCAFCHAQTDPIGFGLENFDGIGRWRTTDNGALIDSTGDLDGTSFDGPRQLNIAIATHPEFIPCVVSTFYSYASGRLPTSAEAAMLSELEAQFVQSGLRWPALMRLVALSDGFRKVAEVSP
ncbi:MAG: DUF1592 domain-containing protein [Myxococcales bacterium]|nr:DUF1592 domain-containing protein [Myxococcales bacterium]